VKRRLYLFASGALLLLSASLSISGGARNSGAAPVTFAKDVAPILYENCAACHRPGEIAPMPLLTYKQARPWAKSIREKVLDRSMPPWHADPAHGKFKNDRSLSKREIDTVVAWVDGGAKEGNPKDLPPLPEFHEGWRMGKPDVVLSMDKEFDVPPEGAVRYQYFYIPTNFKEDRWVQAAEVRAGNPAVVHHVIVFVVGPDVMSRRGLMRDNISGLVGTAPGEEPMELPDGVGRKIKAGSTLVLQMHYTPNGTPQRDKTSVGLVFSRKPVEKELVGGAAMNRLFTIPAGADNHEVRSVYAFKEDARIMHLMPHMHLRGKDYQFKLIYPNGDAKILLSVPRYDFNWQTRYELAEPVFAPKGSRVECIAHFDNSPKNRWNPDPTRIVRWGQQTWEEMMIGFIGFVREDEKLAASAQQKPAP
jgi:mono/diheme cytochrome c family protein